MTTTRPEALAFACWVTQCTDSHSLTGWSGTLVPVVWSFPLPWNCHTTTRRNKNACKAVRACEAAFGRPVVRAAPLGDLRPARQSSTSANKSTKVPEYPSTETKPSDVIAPKYRGASVKHLVFARLHGHATNRNPSAPPLCTLEVHPLLHALRHAMSGLRRP